MDGFSLGLTGDALLTRGIEPPNDADTIALYDLIRAQNAMFTNVEVVPCNFEGHPSLVNGSHLVAHPKVLDHLVEAGFNLFCMANNHAGDYGVAGLLRTIKELDQRNMVHAGIGHNLAESRMPAYLQCVGATVSILACTSSFVMGQEATNQRPDLQGRPGINPLHFDTVYEVLPEHHSALHEIASGLGLEQQRLERITKGFDWPSDPDFAILGKLRFKAAEKPAIRTTANKRDVDDLARWVREARGRSDIVVMSIHSHEQGANDEVAPEFFQPVARRMIDEGADIVVGHGPHMLRGIEVYKGKPIFYSLGNFYGQSDLVSRFASDVFERYRVKDDETPSSIVNSRTDNDRKSFPAERRYWETIMPILQFGNDGGISVVLHAITLGFGQPVHRRGMPALARGQEALSILQRVSDLSAPYGTHIEIDPATATATLALGRG